MKFLIQKIDHRMKHDFSFTLLESIEYQNWLQKDKKAMSAKFIDYDYKNWWFKPFHEHYVPVGSVEFVLAWFWKHQIPFPKPMNVPKELWSRAGRTVWNADENGYYKGYGQLFVKSNDTIKGFKSVIKESYDLPKGNYQFSEVIDIESEWRVFVYQGKLVGLQNYSGDFTLFPDMDSINTMINQYKSAPVAYTLDVGIKPILEVDGSYYNKTFVIECHDFFSCGLYGFANHNIYPYMLYRWFHEYMKSVRNKDN